MYTYRPYLVTTENCFYKKELGDIMKRNRRSTKKSSLVLLSLSISILLACSAQANWIPIGDMVSVSSLPSEGLRVGDKLFSDFDVTGMADGGAHIPTPDSILVQGGQETITGDYGLQFRLAWTVGTEQIINANIDFKVSILPEYDPWLMEDAVLFLMTAGATGTGVVSVSELIYDAPFLGNCITALDTSREENDNGKDLIDRSEFCLDLQPVLTKEIWVETGIIISGGDAGTAQLTEVFMLYSQIPEPATVLLFGLGSLALLRIRRK